MMKKLLILSAMLGVFNLQIGAQCPANDSTSMGSATSNDVYYSLTNHTISTVSNTNWHMAFSVQTTDYIKNPLGGVAIRVNSGGNGSILKKLSGANPANWRTIDTSGLTALPQLLDSDSTWNLSAFTKGYAKTNPFDIIWGDYDQNTHNVNGKAVFVLYNSTAGWYKKILIKTCTYDTMWTFIISNIDNSDSNTVQIRKKLYPNKLFVYYDVLNNQIRDREPAKTTWDLLWTKYITYVSGQQGNGYYPVAGVFSNPMVSVEQNFGKKCNQVWMGNKTSKTDPSMSAIGYDWKTFNGTSYMITDTFVYFVKAQNGKTYKMTFNSYAGGPLGKSTFNFYEATTGIEKKETRYGLSVYPNPNDGLLNIKSDIAVSGIYISDFQGKQVFSTHTIDNIDISDLANGIYTVCLMTERGIFHLQLVKE